VQDLRRDRAHLFGREAERYDRSRPAYPAGLIDDVVGSSPVGIPVLDVGCGTGIASRMLVERGAQVLGVEMSAEMAAIAQRHGIPVEITPFETWDPAGRKFDRVTCAQAWHWLDPVISTDKAASVLRPGGRLCLFWSVGHHPDALADALYETYKGVLPPNSGIVVGYAANRARDPVLTDFDGVRDSLRACAKLAEPETKSFPWNRTYTRDEWLDELLTHSDHMALDAGLRQNLLDQIGRVIDRFGGSFEMPYNTVLISATRL
jgi:SAM-dependent methyltransferase